MRKAKEYSFDEQLETGLKYEAILDNHYKEQYIISKPKDLRDQQKGIDRYYMRKIEVTAGTTFVTKYKSIFSVEYKADIISHTSGFIFLEIELEFNGKPLIGWAGKLTAQALIYLFPQTGEIWWMDALMLKSLLPEWSSIYAVSPWGINKGGLRARGLLIKKDEFFSGCGFIKDRLRKEQI